jgi:RNA-binding protein YlmH
MHSVKTSPPTEIENCLDGFVFHKTLETFIDDFNELDNLLHGKDIDNNLVSYFTMDLRPKEEKILEHFFNTEGVKYKFAKRYVSCDRFFKIKKGRATLTPAWIEEIRAFFS